MLEVAKCHINRKKHAHTSITLSAGAQIPWKKLQKQDKCTLSATWSGYDKSNQWKQQKSRVFYLVSFLRVSQTIVPLHSELHPPISWAIHGGESVFIQRSVSFFAIDNPSNRWTREGNGPEIERKRKKRVSHFCIVCNNDLWIKGESVRETSQRMWDEFRRRGSGKEWIGDVWITWM